MVSDYFFLLSYDQPCLGYQPSLPRRGGYSPQSTLPLIGIENHQPSVLSQPITNRHAFYYSDQPVVPRTPSYHQNLVTPLQLNDPKSPNYWSNPIGSSNSTLPGSRNSSQRPISQNPIAPPIGGQISTGPIGGQYGSGNSSSGPLFFFSQADPNQFSNRSRTSSYRLSPEPDPPTRTRFYYSDY